MNLFFLKRLWVKCAVKNYEFKESHLSLTDFLLIKNLRDSKRLLFKFFKKWIHVTYYDF